MAHKVRLPRLRETIVLPMPPSRDETIPLPDLVFAPMDEPDDETRARLLLRAVLRQAQDRQAQDRQAQDRQAQDRQAQDRQAQDRQ
jgi:hypothetical protein